MEQKESEELPEYKFKEGDLIQVNIRHGFKKEPKWLNVYVLEIMFDVYGPSKVPYYRTTGGTFIEDALRPYQKEK